MDIEFVDKSSTLSKVISRIAELTVPAFIPLFVLLHDPWMAILTCLFLLVNMWKWGPVTNLCLEGLYHGETQLFMRRHT